MTDAQIAADIVWLLTGGVLGTIFGCAVMLLAIMLWEKHND